MTATDYGTAQTTARVLLAQLEEAREHELRLATARGATDRDCIGRPG